MHQHLLLMVKQELAVMLKVAKDMLIYINIIKIKLLLKLEILSMELMMKTIKRKR